MEIKQKPTLTLLIISLLNVMLLSIGHAMSSQVLVLGALVVFAASTIISPKGNFLPLMLFYLPWSPVLKLMPNTFTFSTLVVPIVFLSLILEGLNNERKYKIEHLVLPLFFMAYTLLVKLLNALPIETPYLFFMMMMFFIPIYARRYKADICFERCVLFLTAGVLSACLAAQILMNYPHMLQYIVVDNSEGIGVNRLSGFYGDANYYSAHILVAIAALLTVLGETKKKSLIALQIGLIVALSYFGMLSVSKMFILCFVSLATLWVFNLLLEKRSIRYKLVVIVAVAFIVGIVVASNLFSEQINLYLIRFGVVSDTRTLTTGRTDLWGVYLNYLVSNTDKLFLGIGLSQDQVRLLLKTNNAHNTLIEIVYQLGIIGSLFMVWWWKRLYVELADKIHMGFSKWGYFLMMTVAVVIPWFALDILFFDEFFYFILLLILSRKYLS